jgi:DNA polymerase-4
MVGPKTADQLNQVGIVYISTLSQMPVRILESMFGKSGIILWQKANAIDNTPIEPYSERKSISTEMTFESDTIDMKLLRSHIIKMVEELAFKLRAEEFLTGCVTIKLKYSNFDTETKQCSIPFTSSDKTLIAKGNELFDSLYQRRMLIRLIGVRFSHLVRGNYQISLFDNPIKDINLCLAMDRLRKKFGEDKLGRAV